LLGSADFIIAHNASFDRRMLQSLFPEVLKKQWRCTLTQLSWPETSGRSLGAIANLLNVPQVKAHSAMGDVQTLSACLFHPEHRSNFLKSLLSSPDIKLKNESQYLTAQIAESLNPEVQKYCESLLNIIGAVMADGVLHDSEIQYLNDWLERSSLAVAYWPGNLIAKKVSEILEDGVVTEEERNELTVTLNEIFNGNLKKATDKFVDSPLELDQIDSLEFEGNVFLCTGDFAHLGGKAQSELLIQKRGGLVVGNISKKVNFVVVGGLGSPTWKHGNFGTKVEKAIEYRAAGEPVKIIHEETWARFL
jgi:NAD-dependent DNA ligase